MDKHGREDCIDVIDKAIMEFEKFKAEEKDNDKRIIYSAFVSRLFNIRTAYFADLRRKVDEKEGND